MSQKYKKIGVTTDGYRGERTVLKERVIEGLTQPTFQNSILQLTPESEHTQYLTTSNTSTGYFIVLPKASELWNNWQVVIINNSAVSVNIYYYTEDPTVSANLHLFKEVSAGNMLTAILLDNTSDEGIWTNLRTVDTVSDETIERYTSNIFETYEIPYNQLQTTESSITIPLSMIPATSAVRSIYFKPTEQFTGSTTLTMSIGTETEDNLFYEDIDITGAVSNTNFGKDLFEQILSNDSDLQLFATFTGNTLSSLSAGNIKIVVERQKLIDPTILKNAIVNTTVPMGSIFNYAFANIPAGYVRLDGSEIADAANTIPQFVEFLNKQNNQMIGEKLIVGIDEWNSINNSSDGAGCGKFAWNGSALRFPKITCFIRGSGLNISNLGKFVDEGLPNITGRATNNIQGHNWGTISEGALQWIDGRGDASWEDSTWGYSGISFDASRSNSIYGRSNHVTPKHILYPYIMAVSNKIQWTSQEDYDNLIAASIYKANTDLSNINTTTDILNASLPVNMDYIVESWSSGTSWYRKYKSGWIEQGGAYFTGLSNPQTVNLIVPFTANNYNVQLTKCQNSSEPGAQSVTIVNNSKTTTSFNVYGNDGGSTRRIYAFYWRCEGF